jgi:4beta-methylsterol monooxygenase
MRELIPLRNTRPPSFEQAQNRQQKARAAGMHPDYWYPVEWAKNIGRETVREVIFWKHSIALFRAQDGKLGAVENRCAHCRARLSRGRVDGSELVCCQHGWRYDANGRCTNTPRPLFGDHAPRLELRQYPVRVKHGLVWIFPGNPLLADARKIPEIPELEGPDPWGQIRMDLLVRGHHSTVMDNLSDFTRAALQRTDRLSCDATLTRLESVGDRVQLEYDADNCTHLTVGYEYPYQWSNTDGHIKHWCFVLPIDEQRTRAIFLFYFSHELVKLPGLGSVRLPGWFSRRILMPLARRFHLQPLLTRDAVCVEVEQEGYNQHFMQPIAEPSPAVHRFQELTIRKWEEYLDQAKR